MKIIWFLTLLAFVAAEEEEDTYSTLNDNLDVDSMLADPTTLKAFMDCFLDKAPCSELDQSYKTHTPEAVVQACKRCKVSHKQNFSKFLKSVKITAPDDYLAFRQKYDPEDKYFDALELEISKY